METQPYVPPQISSTTSTSTSTSSIPSGAYPEESWIYIRDRLYAPFSRPNPGVDSEVKVGAGAGVALGSKQYIECYSAVVNFMQGTARGHARERGHVVGRLHEEIEGFLWGRLEGGGRALLVGEEACGNGNGSSSGGLLERYLSEWRVFVAGTRWNGHVLGYLTRHYVRRLRDEGQEVWGVEKRCFLGWKRGVLGLEGVREGLVGEVRGVGGGDCKESEDTEEGWVDVKGLGIDGDREQGDAGDRVRESMAREFRESYDFLRREVGVMGESMVSYEEFIGIRDVPA